MSWRSMDRATRSAAYDNGRALADSAPDQLFHPKDKLVHVCRLGRERLPAREGKQAVRERRCPLGRALRHRHIAVEVDKAALAHAGLHQLQGAGDAGEQVVEVVSKSTGQLTNGLHLLRLLHGLLGARQLIRAFGDAALQRFVEGAQLGFRPIAFRLYGAPLLHIDENTREALRCAVLRMFDAAVGLQPVEMSVGAVGRSQKQVPMIAPALAKPLPVRTCIRSSVDLLRRPGN